MGGWPREPAASQTGQAAEQRRSRGRGVGGQGRTRAALPALVSGVKSALLGTIAKNRLHKSWKDKVEIHYLAT